MESKKKDPEYAKRWRAKYPEKYQEGIAKKCASHKERYATDAQYRAEQIAKAKAYWHENKDAIKARRAASPKRKKAEIEYNDTHKLQQRNSILKKKFGITLDQYNDILSEQNGVCCICGLENNIKNIDGSPKALYVDHCHKTKKVRGLLCMSCNAAIGHFRDDPQSLNRAVDYLIKSRDCQM